jgi:hypothetical protein
MIPDNSKKKLEQLRQEAAFRAQLQQQYDKEMSKVPMAQMVPFSQWMDQRNKPMAEGGKVDPKKAKYLESERKRLKLGEILPREQRDENLRKMLDSSQIKNKLYHATPADIRSFKPGGHDPRVSGHAVWLSPDPAKTPAAHNIGYYDNPREGVNVMPVHVQAKNPMILDDVEMLKWAQQVYGEGSREFPQLMPKKWRDEVIKDYDSIVLADPYKRGDPHEVIMFHPEKIKSAIGNRGTYDTNVNDINKAEGGTVNAFDYENPKHVSNVANIVSKHRDFKQIPDVVKHLASSLSQGSYKFIEDPRIQSAIKKAGHSGYFISGKEGKQQIIQKAMGGVVPSINQMQTELANKTRFKGLSQLQSIGANEAPSMGIKAYVPPAGRPDNGQMPVGGVDTSQGDLPVGGIDMSQQQQGQQLMPNAPPAPAGAQAGMNQVPRGDKIPTMDGTGMPPTPNSNPNQMGSNILQMTPQGQAMAAMKPQGLAKGGSAKSTADMKAELAAKKSIKDGTSTRMKIDAEGPGGVKGIVVPRHMWEGKTYKGEGGKKVEGMRDVNEARAKVYGSEKRDPLNSGQMNSLHKKVLAEHFAKPLHEQTAAEEEALEKLRAAKHIGKTANTLDKSEKLDTVNHEEDAQGRNYVGFASKGVAGHSLYTSGHGENQKHHVINTCAGQTVGCGGGTDKNGIVDTSRGTCFAPNAESQYVNAAVRRASHEQAKHDPAMSKDWILAHTGSLRNAAENADKKNKVLLFRPNVVDETDVTSRHAIRHLNDQRKATGKPNIEANSYGKTNELHDPENGYHVTHSNVGPKTKKGASIEENISRDKARVRNTILAADNKGDFKNEQGNKTPPKGSYLVTDVKRGSEMSKNMEKHIDHAKYWSTGRPKSELTPEEISQGDEGHYGGDHKPTTEDKAHYGHKTVKDLRFDYQKQHILHPRLVQVGFNEDGSKHMIPTDSRFKDTEFLPKNRFKTKNGKEAGHILMTTPTESTSSIGHQTSFTHHVNEGHIEHAKKNAGEYEIDKPEDQIKSAGKEYAAPQAIKFYADGGEVGGRHPGLSDDDFHAFPEQNYAAQRHMALRGHDKESKHSLSDHKRKVTMNKDMDTMLLELTRNKKAK